MAAYKVEICGVNTAKLPLLSNEEKEDLFRRIKEGDMEARDQYIKGNLRLVLSVIQRFASNAENVDDLFQIGCIGLIKAIDNFDTSLQVKFSTYGRDPALYPRQQFHPCQPLPARHGLQGHLCTGGTDQKERQGAHHHGDRR